MYKNILVPVQAFLLAASVAGCSNHAPPKLKSQSVVLHKKEARHTHAKSKMYSEWKEGFLKQPSFKSGEIVSKRLAGLFPYCALIPKDTLTYVSDEWVLDCGRYTRFTNAGRYLIERHLEKEYYKEKLSVEKIVPIPVSELTLG